MDSSWEHLTDSESLLEWERINIFNQGPSELESFSESALCHASPFRHATAKSYPSNPRAPHFSTPREEVHFSLTNLNPGLPAPSFDNSVHPRSLERLPPGNPLPIPLLAETTPKSLRFGEPIAAEHPECGKSSDIAVASHVAKRAKINPNKTTKLPVLGHQADRASMLRSKQPSSNPFIVKQFKCILEKLGDQSGLAVALKASKHPDIHLHRVLDKFAPSTVLKYMSGILHFLKLCSEFHLVWYQLSPIELADLLLQSSLHKSSDESSVGGKNIIKSMRWCAKVTSVLSLEAFRNPLVDSFLYQQETAPLPLWAVVQFERPLLQKSAAQNEVLFLGSCLVAIWGGLRFADAQRMPLSSIVLDRDNIRGSCFRSKTSHKGQPFGCKTSGFLSHGSFNWVIKWLQMVDEIWENSGLSEIESIFLQWHQGSIHVLSYGETIQLLRHYLLTPWRSQSSPLSTCTINFALHSMKTTFLAWTAQRSDVFTDEQRMVQGHHKSQKSSSLRRYSRDGVYPQLQLQSSLISIIQTGWHPALAQHRGAQAPMVEPAVQLERFRKDVEQLTWKKFQFDSNTPDLQDWDISLTEGVQNENIDDKSDSSSDSDTSSSDSEGDTGVTTKQGQFQNDIGGSEEIFVGWTTHIQHAVRVDPSPKPGA